MERVGGEVGGMGLAGREPAELFSYALRAEPSRLEQRGPLHQLDASTACGDRGAAPLGLERRKRDSTACDLERQPHQVAARSASCAADDGPLRHGAAAARQLQVPLEGRLVHAGQYRFEPAWLPLVPAVEAASALMRCRQDVAVFAAAST